MAVAAAITRLPQKKNKTGLYSYLTGKVDYYL